ITIIKFLGIHEISIPVCRTEYSVHSRLVFKRNQAAISTLKELFVSGFVTDRAGKRVQTRHTFSL
ncbi:hypothetical protein, partial [Hominenteromicrobium sp.]|uniref:hypothetical protein n=1 Tax=Hominenteromicrobium sp. TaxID=3073581 RepID=UPI003AF63AA0